MLHFTTKARLREELPADLALLEARVFTTRDESVGQVDGAIVDQRGNIVALAVRLDPSFPNARILAPLRAIELGTSQVEGRSAPVVRLRWTLDQVRAEPPFLRDDRLPDGNGRVPPGLGVKRPGAVKATFKGIGLGGAVGLALGLFTGTLPGVLLAGAFSALCGGLAGVIVGEGEDTATDVADLKREVDGPRPGYYAIGELERRLRDQDLEGRWIRSTPITPASNAGLGVRGEYQSMGR